MIVDKENLCINISPCKGPRDPSVLGEKKRSFSSKPSSQKATIKTSPDEETSTKTFINWINFTFAQQNVISIPCDDSEPASPTETLDANEPASVDSAAAAQALKVRMQKKTEEVIRQKAQSVMRSILVSSAIRSIENEVRDGGLLLRSDCDLHVDLYHQETLTNLLFCYEESWLSVGLSAVFGESIPAGKGSLKKRLQAFIHDKMYSKNNRITLDKKLKQLNRNIIKSFLKVVVFLDAAREASVIPKACLFQMSATCKSSKDMVINFCKNFLQGKHMPFADVKIFSGCKN